jgi:Ca2+-binding EF-hand superfamily protein
MAEKAKAKHAALLVDMEVAELAACFTRYQTAPDLLPIDRIADVFREAGIELNQYRVSQLVSNDMVDCVTLE